jgi:Xaa-Pro aminopeptidase
MTARVYFPKFSDDEYAARWQRIRQAMDQRGLDCLVIYGAYGSSFGSDPGQANLRYVTNFVDQFHAYCIFPKIGEPTLLTSFNGHLATGREITTVPDMRFGGLPLGARIIDLLREKEMTKSRIGIVGISKMRNISIPHEHYVEITEALPDAEFEVATDIIDGLRRIKSDEEIEFLRKGSEITDRAFAAELKAVKRGATNLDLYNEILMESHRAGGTLCFALLGSTPMANPSMSFPDAYISDRKIEKGDVIVNEHSSCYGGYSGQILRTVFVGPPTKDYERMFEIGIDVFHRVKEVIKPGATTADVQKAAAPIIDADLTVTAPLLHGWGNFMEPPIMGVKGSKHPMMEWTFEKGETIVVEPNPCSTDLKSGVFLGDLCVVTENGAESLHTYPIDEPIVVDLT